MLDQLFMQVLDMSKVASIVILAVLLVRLLLKKASRFISYALWAVVLFRLLCPLSVETPVSIVPEITPTAWNYSLADEPISVGGAGLAAYRAVGDALNGGLGIQHIPTTERNENGSVRYVTSDWWDVWILFGQYVWIAGIAAMLLHSIVSYGKIRRKLKVVVPLRGNIYLADDIQSPFVIGFFRPKIYLPCGLSEQEQEYIILHEQYHIMRLDHICKALAFLALCIHWFNPLVWIAFILASKDMEMSCDEAVVREMGGGIRAEYSASLLTLATGRRIIAGAPLAFGEGNVKDRIRNLGKWKQPVLWAVAAAAIVALLISVCLATNPITDGIRTHNITGLVTEIQTDDNGDLTAVVIQTNTGKKTGILFKEHTVASVPDSGVGTPEELRAAFQEAIQPDMTVSADCFYGIDDIKVLTTNNGAWITAYKAHLIELTGRLNRAAASTRDGTQIDVLEGNTFYGLYQRTYQLADGTELLRVNASHNACPVDTLGPTIVHDLTAQRQVYTFYEQRGLLFDEQKELEKVYALYQELEADFCSGLVEQGITATATSSQVMYFLTIVSLPTGYENGNNLYEVRLCDAFDRGTGAHIDTWELFTVPKESVVKALLDESGITHQPLRAEMEAVSWDGRIVFYPDGLSVEFEPGTLPSEPNCSGFFLDYSPAIYELMQDWAVPESRG